jgi:hypothetical protein
MYAVPLVVPLHFPHPRPLPCCALTIAVAAIMANPVRKSFVFMF